MNEIRWLGPFVTMTATATEELKAPYLLGKAGMMYAIGEASNYTSPEEFSDARMADPWLGLDAFTARRPVTRPNAECNALQTVIEYLISTIYRDWTKKSKSEEPFGDPSTNLFNRAGKRAETVGGLLMSSLFYPQQSKDKKLLLARLDADPTTRTYVTKNMRNKYRFVSYASLSYVSPRDLEAIWAMSQDPFLFHGWLLAPWAQLPGRYMNLAEVTHAPLRPAGGTEEDYNQHCMRWMHILNACFVGNKKSKYRKSKNIVTDKQTLLPLYRAHDILTMIPSPGTGKQARWVRALLDKGTFDLEAWQDTGNYRGYQMIKFWEKEHGREWALSMAKTNRTHELCSGFMSKGKELGILDPEDHPKSGFMGSTMKEVWKVTPNARFDRLPDELRASLYISPAKEVLPSLTRAERNTYLDFHLDTQTVMREHEWLLFTKLTPIIGTELARSLARNLGWQARSRVVCEWLCKHANHPRMREAARDLSQDNPVCILIECIHELREEDLVAGENTAIDTAFRNAVTRQLRQGYGGYDPDFEFELPDNVRAEYLVKIDDEEAKVRAIATPFEYVNIGKLLRNCIGGYIQSAARQKSAVYVITTSAQISAFELQFDVRSHSTVAQHHTTSNHRPHASNIEALRVLATRNGWAMNDNAAHAMNDIDLIGHQAQPLRLNDINLDADNVF